MSESDRIVPPASIVIPTLNEEKYLPQLLESFRKVDAPLDIIVVDGNSEDDTAGVVEKFRSSFNDASSLRIVRSKERGIALQRNRGAELAKHDILIFCDADIIIPSPEAYAKVMSEFKKRNYVVAGIRLVPIEPGVRIRLVHEFFYGVQRILFMFGRPYIAGGVLINNEGCVPKSRRIRHQRPAWRRRGLFSTCSKIGIIRFDQHTFSRFCPTTHQIRIHVDI